MLLKEYMALYATTKRHTEDNNRFRVILPLSHTIKLTPTNYSKFMKNVFRWLPFETDEQTSNISRKWEANPNAEYEYNDGILLDAMLFIPETKKEAEQSKIATDLSNLSNLEKWFTSKIETGNRSNMLIRYAYMLIDGGHEYDAVRNAVMSFNSKLKDGLTETEIDSTIMLSVMKKITNKG